MIKHGCFVEFLKTEFFFGSVVKIKISHFSGYQPAKANAASLMQSSSSIAAGGSLWGCQAFSI